VTLRNSLRGTLLGCATVATLLAVAVTPASATFIIDPTPGGSKFFIDVANKNVSSFSGSVGNNNASDPIVNVATVGNVDTGAGFANIKPTNNSTILSSLIFTPVDPNLFSDFSFRGQLDNSGTVTLTVTDNQGNPSQTFPFLITNANQDFDRIGIVSLDGETIKTVEIANPSFKEVKQIEFSGANVPVTTPEPASLAVLGGGLLGAAMLRRRRTRS
jgi:PEP-CTERM motif